MAPCDESCEHKAKSNKQIAFLATRMAMLMVELVRRDLDYGRFCHEEFYTDEIAGYLQQGREYAICMDFVRMMLKKQNRRIDNEMEMAEKNSEEGPEQGLQPAPPSSAAATDAA